MSSRKLKKQVQEALSLDELVEVQAALESLPPKGVVNALFPSLCREDPHLKWYAVSCMGRAVSKLASEGIEDARVVMRRLLWSLNDESGGIGWGAPESMAEIMACQPQLAREYCHMLISYMREDGEELCQDGNFLEHVMLQRGLLWGVGRLSLARAEIMLRHIEPGDLQIYLASDDAEVRGLAAWAAGNLGFSALAERVRGLLEDQRIFLFYLNGQFEKKTVSTLAGEALQRLINE